MASLLEKYRPKTLDDIIGNKKQIQEILSAVNSYRKGKPIMIYGPSGSGKNLAVEIIAGELNYELVELTASDFRDYQSIKQGMLKSATQMSLFRNGKILLVDEMEIADRGMLRGVKELIRESSFPIILIVSNPYDKKFYDLRKVSLLIKFDKVRSDSIKSFLEHVASDEGIDFDEKSISQLARIADGDVRSALIDMKAMGEVTEKSMALLGQRNFRQSVFETLKIIFKTTESENSRLAIENSEKDIEELFWWIEENIFREYENPKDIAASYEFLAKADYFSSLILRRQSWGLQKYVTDEISFVSVAKESPYRKFSMYQPPKFFMHLGARKGADMVSAIEKISRATHTSRIKSLAYIPMIKRLSKEGLIEEFLTEKEIEAIESF